MKSTGMVRPIDLLGRVVLPMEIRNTMDISTKDALVCTVKDDLLILQKQDVPCVFCKQESKDVIAFKGKSICQNCLKGLLEK